MSTLTLSCICAAWLIAAGLLCRAAMRAEERARSQTARRED